MEYHIRNHLRPHDCNKTQQQLGPIDAVWNESTSSAEGLELIVEIEINPRGTTDDYIDNLISLTVDVEGTDNIVRCDRATLLAFDTCSRPLHENEPIPRETMEARNKLESEALLEEQKVILGWLIHFRRLLIRLPKNKFVAWSEAIRKMIKDEVSMAKRYRGQHRMPRSPGPSHTICTSLHESIERPTFNC